MKKVIILFVLFATTILSVNAQIVNDSTTTIPQDKSLVMQVENWYANNMNYLSITLLMTVESSFIPFPSEIVIPPAAYVAGKEDSSLHATNSYPLNVLLIVLFGTIGALLGAIINYFLALWLGRPIIYAFADSKIGHLCLLSSEKVKLARVTSPCFTVTVAPSAKVP